MKDDMSLNKETKPNQTSLLFVYVTLSVVDINVLKWETLLDIIYIYIYIYIYICYRALAWLLECSSMAQVESYQRLKKWYLMPPCLTLSIIRYRSRVKWINPEEGLAPSPTPLCSSYRKWSLRVTLNYDHELYICCFKSMCMVSNTF